MNISQQHTVSSTELVRNLAALIDQVRILHLPITITKGSQTVAELTPPPKPGLSVTDLRQMLSTLPSLGDDASNMASDLAMIRQQAKLPANPWE